MRIAVVVTLAALLVACESSNSDGIDMSLPFCATIQPGQPFPTGPCTPGRLCMGEFGGSCSCDFTAIWFCTPPGGHDMAHPYYDLAAHDQRRA